MVGRRSLIDATSGLHGHLQTGICGLTRPIEKAVELLEYLESLSRPSPGGSIRGVVRLARGRVVAAGGKNEPLAGIRLELDGPVTRSTTTGADGVFAFDPLPPGEYSVRPNTSDRPGMVVVETASSRGEVLPPDTACPTCMRARRPRSRWRSTASSRAS